LHLNPWKSCPDTHQDKRFGNRKIDLPCSSFLTRNIAINSFVNNNNNKLYVVYNNINIKHTEMGSIEVLDALITFPTSHNVCAILRKSSKNQYTDIWLCMM